MPFPPAAHLSADPALEAQSFLGPREGSAGRGPSDGPLPGHRASPHFPPGPGLSSGGRAGSGLSSGSTQAVQRLAAWLPCDQGGSARPGPHVPCEEKGPLWVLVRMNELEEHHGSAWHVTRALCCRWRDLALESGCKVSAVMRQLPPGPWAGTRQEAGSSFAGLSLTRPWVEHQRRKAKFFRCFISHFEKKPRF